LLLLLLLLLLFHKHKACRQLKIKQGQALEQKYCLSAVLGYKCDPSANLLNQFNSHLLPCPGSFNGNWEEEVSTSKITILGGLIGCGSWTACGVM